MQKRTTVGCTVRLRRRAASSVSTGASFQRLAFASNGCPDGQSSGTAVRSRIPRGCLKHSSNTLASSTTPLRWYRVPPVTSGDRTPPMCRTHKAVSSQPRAGQAERRLESAPVPWTGRPNLAASVSRTSTQTFPALRLLPLQSLTGLTCGALAGTCIGAPSLLSAYTQRGWVRPRPALSGPRRGRALSQRQQPDCAVSTLVTPAA